MGHFARISTLLTNQLRTGQSNLQYHQTL